MGVRMTPVYTLISERVGSVTDSQALNHNQASLSSFIFNRFIHSGCDTCGVFAWQREIPGPFRLGRHEATAVVALHHVQFPAIDATSAFEHVAASVCVYGSLLRLCPGLRQHEQTLMQADSAPPSCARQR